MATEKLIDSFATNPNTDQADTTLNNGGTLTSGAPSLTVNTLPTGVSAAQFRMKIDDEIIIVGAIGGAGNKTWSSLTRGAEGTTAASHVDGSNVYIVTTSGGFAQWLTDSLAATPPAPAAHASTHSPGGSDPVLAYLCYQDQKTQNTDGGGFTSGAWRTRDINTEVADTGGFGSVASNQITLAAGTYRCFIHAPAYSVTKHQARLQNITDTATTLVGTSEYASHTASADQPESRSIIVGRFTIAGTKTFEVQHQCSATEGTNGFGVKANFTTEIYTVAEFWKEA